MINDSVVKTIAQSIRAKGYEVSDEYVRYRVNLFLAEENLPIPLVHRKDVISAAL